MDISASTIFDRPAPRSPHGSPAARAPYTDSQTVLVLVAALAFIGALIHAGAAADHWSEYHLYTLAFSSLAVLQVGWTLLIVRGASTRTLVLGCALQLGIVALWALSRTAGVPFAPTAWTREEIGVADLTETVGELVTVLAVLSVLFGERSNATRAARRWMPSVLLLAILISVLFGTGAHAG